MVILPITHYVTQTRKVWNTILEVVVVRLKINVKKDAVKEAKKLENALNFARVSVSTLYALHTVLAEKQIAHLAPLL
jgi:hypothetical protein